MVRSKRKYSGFDFINLSSTSGWGKAKNKSAKYGKGAKKMHRKGKRGENA